MLKKQSSVVLGLLLLTLSICVSIYTPTSSAQSPTTLNVPSQQYPTIQSAFNAAPNGSIINIAAGTYNESPKTVVWADGVLQTFYSVEIQGSKDTVIIGDVVLGPLIIGKVDSLTINGKLTIGNSLEGVVNGSTFSNIKATTIQSYTMNSFFSHVQVTSNFYLAGSYNILKDSILNQVDLGGNGPGAQTAFNRIEDNNISGGISIPGAISTIIVGNLIDGAQKGISEAPLTPSRYGSGGHTVFNNTIQNCGTALNLASTTFYHSASTVSQNTLKNNDVGIAIQFGPYPLDSNNTVYRNNFVNNKLQVNCTGTAAASDRWSSGNPPNGNYWSDYTGVDANGDGIGDTPYIINSVNNDTYPLMSTYPPTQTTTPTPTPSPTPEPTTTSTQSASPTTQPSQSPTSTPTATLDPTGANAIPEINAAYPLIALMAISVALSILAILKKK